MMDTPSIETYTPFDKGIYDRLPGHLHLEPTKACNARCPQCTRTFLGSLETLPSLDLAEISPQEIDDMLNNDPFFANVYSVFINGNHGDIVMHSQPKEFLETIINNPRIKELWVNTNGGGLSTDFWNWLGKQHGIRTGKKIKVEFAIDGLADTHHLYRRNTRFDTVIKNAAAFIEGGGIALCAMNVFENNRHQVEELRNIVADMGFAHFETRNSQRFLGDAYQCVDKDYNEIYKLIPLQEVQQQHNLQPAKTFTPDEYRDMKKMYSERSWIKTNTMREEKDWQQVERQNYTDYKIDCIVGMQMPRSVFVTGDMKLYPCCWMENNHGYFNLLGDYSDFQKTFGHLDKDFNSLRHKTAYEIIESSDLFGKIESKWGTTDCFEVCAKHCGKKKNNC